MVCHLEQRKGNRVSDPRGGDGREQMLARLVAYVRANGVPADSSLRRLAQELDTSHRMLAYYFGSRDGLLATVLMAMRADEKKSLTSTAESWGLRDAALAMWSYYTDSEQLGEHRAFFYVFSRALQQPGSYGDFLSSLESWSTLTAQLGVAQGIEPERAGHLAQLIVSAVRGLLMDRLAGADPDRIDDAFTLLLDELLPEQPAGTRPKRLPARAAARRRQPQ
jgi:AcrR family transcriptional regulator